MLAILRKEITLFFSSLIGYITIGIFLTGIGLFMWVLPDFSVLNYGYATMEQLFKLGPFVFLFLIPAITMRSFAEEQKTGTLEILVTKPVSDFQIVLAKFLAVMLLVILSLIPTLLYYYTVSHLAVPQGNVDSGATWGSYIGLLFLGGAYAAMGLFASSITDNQIVAFIISLFLCFFFYQLLDLFQDISFLKVAAPIMTALSIQSHYTSISRGVLDTRDLIYFISFIALFLLFTKTVVQSRKW